MRTKRRKKLRVSYTISLSWTKAEAVRFARNYLRPYDHSPFTIKQFLEESESDFVFEEFIEEDAYRNPTLDSYFDYVAGRL